MSKQNKGFDLPEDMDNSNEEMDHVEDQETEYEVDESDAAEEPEYEVEDEDDGDAAETETVEDVAKRRQSKKMYTPEEIKRILRDQDFTAIDTSRLSEEGKAVMKAMQAGLTPKLQESAELRRELAEIRQALKESAPKTPPKDIYEAYDRDPSGTMEYVNRRIQAMISEGADTLEIEKVREVREQLRQRDIINSRKQMEQASRQQELVNTLLRAVPDIEKKQYELREFALEYMGMTPQELDEETNLSARGIDAVRMISRINTAYDKMMAGKRAKAKAKAKPIKTEKPGGGFEKKSASRSDLIAHAKKTGDWGPYFKSLEE